MLGTLTYTSAGSADRGLVMPGPVWKTGGPFKKGLNVCRNTREMR